MGNIFVRLKNLVVGFFGLFVSGLEQSNPEIAFQNSINSMKRKFAQAKTATSALIRRRTEIAQRLAASEQALEQVAANLDAAMDQDDDTLALICVEKQEILEASIKDLKAELTQAEQESVDAKDSLNDFKVEIGKMEAEKDRMMAKLNSAESRIMIQDQLDGLSIDAEIQALDGVRDHIKNKIAEADLGAELAGSDVDNQMKKLTRKSGGVRAKSKLAKLKAARKGGQQDMSEFAEVLANTEARGK